MSCGTYFFANIALTMATSHFSRVLPGRRATLLLPAGFRLPTVNMMTCEGQEFAGKQSKISLSYGRPRGDRPRAPGSS